MVPNLGSPAVSHICSLTILVSMLTLLVLNSMPTVGLLTGLNPSGLMKRWRMFVLPVFESPINASLKTQSNLAAMVRGRATEAKVDTKHDSAWATLRVRQYTQELGHSPTSCDRVTRAGLTRALSLRR
eukprot:m.486804 g.486804  ORF g.486804 m.486804 type:complete len:128 (-) comp24599_c0_seq1:255-638(-)